MKYSYAVWRGISLKKLYTGLLLAEILVCIWMLVTAYQYGNSSWMEIPLSDWKSDYISYQDGWYIDESLLRTEETADMIYGPYLPFQKGTYTVWIDYESDHNQSCRVYANAGNDAYLKGEGMCRLSGNQTSAAFGFTLKKDIDNLEVVVKYDGKGFLNIKNIRIRKDSAGVCRMLFFVFCMFLLLDLFIFTRPVLKKNRNLLMCMGGIILLSSLPLFTKGVIVGHDLSFHLMRIEGIAQEIRNGNLPVRLSSLWMDGYGYPVSIYYGDLLLYFPAICRIGGGLTIASAYKLYVFLINAGTALLSFFCFRKVFINKKTALLLSFVYVTSGYRIVNLYVRAAVGEYTAMMFFPVLAMVLYRIYTEDSSDWKRYRRNAPVLAVGMTGLICTHVLSTEMMVFVMFFTGIVLWKKTLRKNTMKVYGLAAVETAALSAYFWIPFLDYYLHENVSINRTVEDVVKKIQGSGAYVGQYFCFFQNIFGSGTQQERMGMSPGPVLMAVLLAAAVMWINKKADRQIKYLLVFSVAMLFLATDLFPWDALAAHWKAGRVMSQVQFPWRYIGIAIILLTLLFGCMLQFCSENILPCGIVEKIHMAVAGICVLMALFYASSCADHADMAYYQHTAELNDYSIGGGEYIRTGTNTDAFTGSIQEENMRKVSLLSHIGCQMEIYCETGENDGSLELPLLNYKGYTVTDESGNTYDITDGANNVIRFSLPAHFSGKIWIDFEEPWYWRMGGLISVVAGLGLCIRKGNELMRINFVRE